jgi:predicted Zn-ribbon and HTH transcriptional regulator
MMPITFKLITVLRCEKCDFKSLREFRKDDYVMRKMEKCPICSSEMIVSSIYRET